MTSTIVICALGPVIVFFVLKLFRIGRRENYLPNGPPTIPLLGNIHIFPIGHPYFKFTEWARIYGGIYSLKIGPATAIVLTDMTIVKELMEKRSQATSDRPSIYAAELVTDGMHLVFEKYTDNWRVLRRVVHEALTQTACLKHLPIQKAESMQVLYDCLHNPEGFYGHISRHAFSIILSILFGKRTPRLETQEIVDYHNMLESWQKVLTPGVVPPVEHLPFLKYLPRFLAPWKGYCEATRRMQHSLYYGLLNEAQDRISHGQENGSFIEQVLSRQAQLGLTDEQIGYLGGVLMEAGGGTTASWLKSLVLAMVAYPEAQKKAHDELDGIIGTERMPTLEDLPRLPYIQAIMKEVHRWRPVAPIAIPHATTEDIHYAGYRIPNGSTIFINTWGMSHDPDVYERPEDFWPDRWMLDQFGAKPDASATGLNPAWFGSGRRACPGIYLAENSLAINTLNLLWAFSFAPELDPQTGKLGKLNTFQFAEGFELCPKPFGCVITPRSPHRAEMIGHEFAEACAVLEQYEYGLSTEDQAYVKSQRI